MTFGNQNGDTQEIEKSEGTSNPSGAANNSEGQPTYEELKARMDELVKGTNKVMEENARYRKAFDTMSSSEQEAESLSQEELDARQMLSERLGFADKNSVEALINSRMKAAEDKSELDSLMREFPELVPHRGYIEKIGMVEGTKTWDEIIADTQLVEREKLEQARRLPIRGSISPKDGPGEKSISGMSDEEYDAFLTKNTQNKRYK